MSTAARPSDPPRGAPSRDALGKMLHSVRRRLAWAAFEDTLRWTAAVACGVVLLAAPAAWLRPGWLVPIVSWAVPAAAVLALLMAWVLRKRPTLADAANRADGFAGTKDLFLTAVETEDTEAPAMAGLVRAEAVAQAPRVDPTRAVPLALSGRDLVPAGVAFALLAAALFLLPKVDPFGAVAAAEEVEQAVEESEQKKEAAEKRVAELKSKKPEAELSPAVSAAVERLKNDLRAAKKAEVKRNRKKITKRQGELGQLWRNLSAEKMRELLSDDGDRRLLGGRAGEEAKNWKRELKSGSAKSMREAIRKMAAQAAEAARETDPEKRAEKMQALREQARKMENFARREAGNEDLANALQRAGEQLQRAADQMKGGGPMSEADKREMMKKAAEAAEKLLEQAEMEAESLAQSARDLKEVEKAMAAAQAAKQANEMGQLDGQEATDAESLREFMEVYEEILRESGIEPTEAMEGSVAASGEGEGEGEGDGEDGDGDGEGEGTGGQGRGERDEFDPGAMVEDPNSKTGFKTELSQSHLVAGKTLMSMKSKGEAERGERTTEYDAAVGALREGLDEAIVAEDVPPGYHDRIKGYFDSLAPPAGTPPAGTAGDDE